MINGPAASDTVIFSPLKHACTFTLRLTMVGGVLAGLVGKVARVVLKCLQLLILLLPIMQ